MDDDDSIARLPPYARDLPVLKELFVSQKQHLEFVQTISTQIHEGYDSLYKEIIANREMVRGFRDETATEIGELKQQTKLLAQSQKNPSIGFYTLGKIIGGFVIAISCVVIVLDFTHRFLGWP